MKFSRILMPVASADRALVEEVFFSSLGGINKYMTYMKSTGLLAMLATTNTTLSMKLKVIRFDFHPGSLCMCNVLSIYLSLFIDVFKYVYNLS